ncbi:histidine--tRNA ligase [Ferruginivarius sediminum]|uniref:Histidine--tRNA ligase n=1 Tax=Ferruginivarius sediminum TaxID=2661937 RepID=A0A369TJB4_9PROT|nr:histidine--tRNA ligase [Ferruginivarius sediminum]RDD62986.1 histidine--tRNA ligase [Ferruginivarius sediminum]
MSAKKTIKPRAISGFPEWLPEIRIVEQQWMNEIRRIFESYGFCSIDPPSVEDIDVLTSKGGDTDKEIYALRRLQAEDGGDEARVALHYDLTVPLARYVAQHFNDLAFPFKRYQIQRAWRGERPQEGRFREFYQCDIDVVDVDNVALDFDAELPAVILEVLASLGLDRVSMHINNRKILQGFYEGLGIENVVETIRVVDKMDKIGPEGVAKMLVDDAGIDAATAQRCVELASIRSTDTSFAERVRALDVKSELLDEGLDELTFVLEHLASVTQEQAVADLAIARGFDYYTGTVYEGKLIDYPDYPSILSGGRYDDLVGSFLRRRLPGVGLSIGLTRIFAKLVKEGQIQPGPKCPTDVLVVQLPGVDRAVARDTGRHLRRRGFNVEVYHEAKKVGAQMKYADRKGIPYVCFPPGEPGALPEFKDMQSGEQTSVSLDAWSPSGSGGTFKARTVSA